MASGPLHGNCVLLGVAGPSGAGKTTFARAVVQAAAPLRSVLLSCDDYYRDLAALPLSEREQCNFDHPDALDVDLLAAHLHALRRKESIDKPLYDFTRHTRRPESEGVSSAPLVVVEGILVLAVPDLRRCLDLAVYVDAPPDICLARRVLRDVVERGRSVESVIAQYVRTVRPMLLEHVLPSRAHADIVVSQESFTACAREVLERLHAHLRDLPEGPDYEAVAV